MKSKPEEFGFPPPAPADWSLSGWAGDLRTDTSLASGNATNLNCWWLQETDTSVFLLEVFHISRQLTVKYQPLVQSVIFGPGLMLRGRMLAWPVSGPVLEPWHCKKDTFHVHGFLGFRHLKALIKIYLNCYLWLSFFDVKSGLIIKECTRRLNY